MSLLLDWRVWAAIGVAALAFWGFTMKSQRDSITVEYAEYRTKTAQAAVAAAEQALKKTIADEQAKEKIDAENLRLHADLDAAARKLRNARDSSGFLSAATTCPSSPSQTAKYKAEFERAYRIFVSGLREVGDECSGETIDLNSAKKAVMETNKNKGVTP